MRSSVTLLVMVMLLGPTSAPAQPKTAEKEAAFGFHKGMTLKQAKSVAVLKPLVRAVNTFYTTKPPRPFSAFQTYMVTISPAVGVCRVMAMNTTKAPGSKELQPIQVTITDALVEKYGPPGPKIVGEGESTLAVWINPLGPYTAIKLSMDHDADGSTSVMVNYFFSNYEKCRTEEASGL